MARNCKKVENNITDEKQVMDLAMKAGQILLENGAEISRVGETMEHICSSFGVDSAHNFVLSNGIILTGDSYAKVRHILAGIGLLAVATWLGNAGKNNKMFLIPMAFMIVVTICSLCLTVKNQIGMIAAGGADWGPWAQTIFGILLILLAIVLVIEGVQTLKNPKKVAA